MDVNYDTRVTVRLTPTQAAKLRTLATATHRDRSQVLRLLLDSALSDGRPDIYLDAARLERGRTYATR